MTWNISSGEVSVDAISGEYDLEFSLSKFPASTSRLLASSTYNSSSVGDNGTWAIVVPGYPEQGHTSMDMGSSWSDCASYVFGVLCLFVASVGLMFNTMVIFSVIHNRQLRSHVANVFICNLAVGSLIACIIMLTVEVPVRLLSRTVLADYQQTTCNAIGFVTSVLNIGAIWTVVALSVDKCRSIDSPLRHSFLATSVKMITYIFCIWISAFLTSSFPFLFGQRYVFQPAEGTCDLDFDNNDRWWYIVIYLIVIYYIPGSLVCFCHWRIFAIARIQSRRMATMVHLVTLIQVPLLNGRTPTNQQLSPQGRKAIYTTSIFVGTFVICYLPHALVTTSRLFCGVLSNQILISITTLLQRSAFVVNIFIYGCRNRMVRDSLSKYVRRKLLDHASAIQRKGRRQQRSSRNRSIVRVDRPSRTGSTYQRVGLHPTRSQPILNSTKMTPVLHRAISLDVDVNIDDTHEQLNTASGSSRDFNNCNSARSVTDSPLHNGESLDIIEEDQPLTITIAPYVSPTSSEPNDQENEEDEEDACATTPMLNPVQIEMESPKNGILLNGLRPFPVSQTDFVEMKESVV